MHFKNQICHLLEECLQNKLVFIIVPDVTVKRGPQDLRRTNYENVIWSKLLLILVDIFLKQEYSSCDWEFLLGIGKLFLCYFICYLCDRRNSLVTGIVFPDSNCICVTGMLFLWQEFYSFNRNFCSWYRNFVSVIFEQIILCEVLTFCVNLVARLTVITDYPFMLKGCLQD